MDRKRVAFVLLALGSVTALWARNGDEPEVLVRLIDTYRVPQPLLFRAKDTAGQILASAGVHVRWGRMGSRPGAETMDVIDVRFAYSFPETYKPKALAEAFPFAGNGVRINIFFNRLASTIKLYELSAGSILGHVLAHEIGHVLLQEGSHAQTGLMKPYWTGLDYSGMVLKNLEFTAADANRIRINLVGRIPFQAAPRPSFGLAASAGSVRP